MTTRMAYPSYKSSGTDWIGDVPAHWNTQKLRDLAHINHLSLPETTEPSFHFEYIDIGSVGTGMLVERPEHISFRDSPSRARRVVKNGDTILSTVRTYLKAVFHFDSIIGPTIVSTGFATLTPKPDVHDRYLKWAIVSDGFVSEIEAQSTGVSYPAISESRVSKLSLPLPPLDEQRAIADYLDHKDAQITRFIESRRRMIALLEEKKQAIINQSVTKGLDPSVPMKDSGVEWLGEIPAHWEVRRLRTLANGDVNSFTDGDWVESPYIESDGIRLIQTGNVRRGHYRDQGFRYISEKTFDELNCKEVNAGDVLICRLGDPVSRACVAPDLGVKMITSVDNCMLKTSSDVSAVFTTYCLNCDNYLDWVAAQVRGSTRDRVSRKMLGAFPIPIPPLIEQQTIAKHLEHLDHLFSGQKSRLEREIELMQEYRTRLISDVVTGKMKVG